MIARLSLPFLAALLSFVPSLARETKPWLDKTFEFQPRLSCEFETFNQVSGSHGKWNQRARDCFYKVEVGLPIYYPDFKGTNHQGDIQLEAVVADTTYRSFGVDCLQLTGRYLFMNDITGDPIAVLIGATVAQAFRQALDDIGSFHHGLFEGELHLSFGRETACGPCWLSRWWGVLAIGAADVGSPWVRGDLFFEMNFCNKGRITAFVNTLWGMGHSNLHPHHHFSGYGPIHHQSVDAGCRLGYWFDCGGELSAEYARRVFSKNFPSGANCYQVSFLYPFGL